MLPTTMLAAVVETSGHPLVLRRLPVPVPRPGEVLVRTEACGVCHTDLHAANGDWPVKPQLPLVPGHEGVGTVVVVGPGVTAVKEGDRVGVPWLYSACGECEHCLAGWETVCERAEFSGYTQNGGFAEYIVADAAYVARIPAGLSANEAAPIICAGVTSYKGIKVTEAKPGEWIVISGVGGLGHLAIQYARAMGLRVCAVDIDDAKLAHATRLGAEVVVNARGEGASAVYGETLGVSALGVEDTDGDALTVHYAWFINGSVVAEHDGGESDVLATTILRGDEVYVRAYVTDGQLTSDTVSSNTITIGDTAPTLSVVELSPNPAYEADTLSCTPADGADVDGDAIRYAYGWTVNGALVAASTSTLTGSYFSRGNTVSCSATPSDDGATGVAAYSGEISVSNTLPTLGSVSISPSAAVTGDTLSSSVTGWFDADGDAEHRIYSWVVDGVAAGSGATLAGVARGEEIYLEVTPNDGTDDGATVTSNTVTVGNATPRITGASISPTTLYNDSTPVATATGFTDADGDSPSYRYQWYLNGVAASGETSAALASTLTTGEQVQVRIWPSDGTIEGSNVASSVLTVQNRTPVASAVVLDSDPILTCDEIQLSAIGSSDADGTALTYAWTVNSRPAGAVRATADLDSASDAEPYFIVDADGAWMFGLVVSDGSLSATDSVAIDVEPRGYNTDPVADAGADLAESTESACSTSGHGTVCVPCPTVEFDLDGGASVDADGDPLLYSWAMAATPGASLSGSSTVDPMLSIGGMTPNFGVTTTVTVTLTLVTRDCAEGSDSDSVTVTYECTGI